MIFRNEVLAMHYNDDTRSLHGMLCSQSFVKDFEYGALVIDSPKEAQDRVIYLKECIEDREKYSLEERRLMKYSIKAIEHVLR